VLRNWRKGKDAGPGDSPLKPLKARSAHIMKIRTSASRSIRASLRGKRGKRGKDEADFPKEQRILLNVARLRKKQHRVVELKRGNESHTCNSESDEEGVCHSLQEKNRTELLFLSQSEESTPSGKGESEEIPLMDHCKKVSSSCRE